jgi:diketogulonate reductase-like aldo/keto reductase
MMTPIPKETPATPASTQASTQASMQAPQEKAKRQPESGCANPLSGLGQGTWGMGENPNNARPEIAALQRGIDLGMCLIDTAEMYADGGAEKIVGAAIAGRRDQVCLVSKVMPHHADRRGTVAACESSLRRLRVDRIDLYLLHWRGGVPLAETLEAFALLQASGKIARWGVSNFDMDDMNELAGIAGAGEVATNQILYNLTRRGVEFDLLPWCEKTRMPVMAYSPVEQGRLLSSPPLSRIAQRRGASPAQIALAWVLRRPGVMAIPKASSIAHVEQNHGALTIRLEPEDLAELDSAFPPPDKAVPLDML